MYEVKAENRELTMMPDNTSPNIFDPLALVATRLTMMTVSREKMKADWDSTDWDGKMELIEDWDLVDEYDEWEGEEWEREVLMDAKDW